MLLEKTQDRRKIWWYRKEVGWSWGNVFKYMRGNRSMHKWSVWALRGPWTAHPKLWEKAEARDIDAGSLVAIMVDLMKSSFWWLLFSQRNKKPCSYLGDWRNGKENGPEKHRRIARQHWWSLMREEPSVWVFIFHWLHSFVWMQAMIYSGDEFN